jgi:branched-chain amino acid transport system ATP-binding protein
VLEIRRIDAGYGETTVLRGVSLVVPDGRVVALLGANGAGKTTVLRAASGLLRPSAGHVRLDGIDVTGWSPHRLVRLGLCHIPEGRGVFPQLTVRENLVLQSPAGQETAAIERACGVFAALGRRLGQRAGLLSGGEQQMLALARAYVNSPRLVLLDEVSMGLAPIVVDEIFGFLERLAKEGAAMLLVEQYVTRALDLADYVYILTRGTVSFAGEPAELEDESLFRHYIAG